MKSGFEQLRFSVGGTSPGAVRAALGPLGAGGVERSDLPLLYPHTSPSQGEAEPRSQSHAVTTLHPSREAAGEGKTRARQTSVQSRKTAKTPRSTTPVISSRQHTSQAAESERSDPRQQPQDHAKMNTEPPSSLGQRASQPSTPTMGRTNSAAI